MTSTAVSPAEILRDVLVSLGAGVSGSTSPTGAWPIFVASEPDMAEIPDNCITTYDTAPQLNGRTAYDGLHNDFYGVQVRVRSANHPVGWTKAAGIRELLEAALNVSVTIGTVVYILHCANRVSGPLAMGRADSGSRRRLFTINYYLVIS